VRTIVTIVGSSQPSSFTGKALVVVNEELGRLGFDVTTFDGGILRLDFPGRPASEDGERLRAAVREAAGVVLSTPEYHGSMSAMTKLVIENLGFPSALQGKPVALLGVAAGRIGAVKSIEHLRSVCGHIGALVVPNAISIANVRQAFDANGHVTDPGTEASLRELARSLEAFMRDYVCPKFVLEAAAREGAVAPPWTATI
jgi:NAD(P)H-dependent FMN reductase